MKMTTMAHLLCNSYSLPSARILRDALKELGLKLIVTSRPERVNRFPVVRYGNSFMFDFKSGCDSILNSPKIIRLLSNKKNFSDLLLSSGVSSPKFEKLNIENFGGEFPVIVRESLSLSGGRGLHVIEDKDSLEQFSERRVYWTPFVFLDFELRVHCLGGQIVKIFKKMKTDGQEIEKYPIRNLHRGYHFSLKSNDTYPKLKEVVEKIYSILPEKECFMALDVGWDRNKREYFIIEGNSAPGLNEETAKLYAEYIYKILKGEN